MTLTAAGRGRTWGRARWRWRGRWWRGWSPQSGPRGSSRASSTDHPETWTSYLQIYILLSCYLHNSSDLHGGVGGEVGVVLVLVVGGVAVVDAARVVAHAGDGHAVGVAEHRRHHSTVFSVQSMCRVGTICTLTPPHSLHRPASLPAWHSPQTSTSTLLLLANSVQCNNVTIVQISLDITHFETLLTAEASYHLTHPSHQ